MRARIFCYIRFVCYIGCSVYNLKPATILGILSKWISKRERSAVNSATFFLQRCCEIENLKINLLLPFNFPGVLRVWDRDWFCSNDLNHLITSLCEWVWVAGACLCFCMDQNTFLIASEIVIVLMIWSISNIPTLNWPRAQDLLLLILLLLFYFSNFLRTLNFILQHFSQFINMTDCPWCTISFA